MTAKRRLQTLTAAAALFVLAACSSVAAQTGAGLKLSGDQEVPPVTTTATGISTVKIAADGSVTGSITTTGLDGTMAHIHIAPMGKNGPVIVPFVKTADGVWSPQPGAKLTPDQLKAYQAGELYLNVHTAANKGGEIRAQLMP
jgi:hypothetical protein